MPKKSLDIHFLAFIQKENGCKSFIVNLKMPIFGTIPCFDIGKISVKFNNSNLNGSIYCFF